MARKGDVQKRIDEENARIKRLAEALPPKCIFPGCTNTEMRCSRSWHIDDNHEHCNDQVCGDHERVVSFILDKVREGLTLKSRDY